MFKLNFDWLSYILGIFTGTLIWFIISRIRLWLPALLKIIRQQAEEYRRQRLSGADLALRQSAIRKAQAAHIASPLFRLDDVIIPPLLLAPTLQQDPGAPQPPASIADQVIPYLPLWPEFTAALSPHRLTFQQVLTAGVNPIIAGEAGCGKTAALAWLASLVARQDPSLGDCAEFLPIYLHAHDFLTPAPADQPKIDTFTWIIAHTIPGQYSKQLPALIQSTLAQKHLVLILDGLDELHPEKELPIVTTFLVELLKACPALRMVAATSPYAMEGLVTAGLQPFVLAPWSNADKNELQERWINLWAQKIQPGLKTQPEAVVDPHLLLQWERDLPLYLNPLELTLRLWSLLSGDLQQGTIAYAGIETYITRAIPSEAGRLAVEKLSAGMIVDQHSALSYAEIETLLAEALKTGEAAPQPEPGTDKQNPPSRLRPAIRLERKSSAAQLLDHLLTSGLLLSQGNGLIRFSHLQVMGYLASFALPSDLPRSLFEPVHWPTNTQILHYITTQGGADLWIETILREEDGPLYWNRFMISRWLKDVPASAAWKSAFLREMITLIHKENLPFAVRTSLFAGVLSSADPSLGSVVKQLLGSPNPTIRRMSALAAGILKAAGLVNSLLDLLPDTNTEISLSAILAFGAFANAKSEEICLEILMNGSEIQRQAAAEALCQSAAGREALLKAAEFDDLLVRRAAVHGLSMLHNPQIQKLMEKISVEDGQWIVRTAAAEALDWMQKPDPHIPIQISPPAEAPWLIAFASKSGVVFTKNQPAIPLLLDALKNGAPEERIRSIDFLAREQDEGVIASLYNQLYSQSETLSQASATALWLIAANGAEMPSQAKFGLG